MMRNTITINSTNEEDVHCSLLKFTGVLANQFILYARRFDDHVQARSFGSPSRHSTLNGCPSEEIEEISSGDEGGMNNLVVSTEPRYANGEILESLFDANGDVLYVPLTKKVWQNRP